MLKIDNKDLFIIILFVNILCHFHKVNIKNLFSLIPEVYLESSMFFIHLFEKKDFFTSSNFYVFLKTNALNMKTKFLAINQNNFSLN